MTHVFRWNGIIAFVVIVTLLVAGWVVFADTLARRAAESLGTRMAGAEVDVAAADVGVSPLRLEFDGLQVTNARQPMRNAVEIGKLGFDASLSGFLLGRTEIGRISVEGLRLDTPRKRRGTVTRATKSAPGLFAGLAESLKIPSLSLPSVADALGGNALRSPDVISETTDQIEKTRKDMANRLDALPGKKEADGYRQRIREVTQGSDVAARLKGVKQLAELRQQIQTDLDRIQATRQAMDESLTAIQSQISEARAAPQEDLQRIYSRYTDTSKIGQSLARALLGPRVTGWFNAGWSWYQRLSPYLGRIQALAGRGTGVKPLRRKGIDVLFPEREPKPEVLVHSIVLSGSGENGGPALRGQIRNLAMPASRWREPLSFEISGNRVAGIRELHFNGQLDRRNPADTRTRLSLSLAGLQTDGMAFGPEGDVQITSGTADVSLNGTLEQDQLDFLLEAKFHGTRFAAGGKDNALPAQVLKALSAIREFNLTARVTGTPERPTIAMNSSLDSALRQAVAGIASDKAEAFRKDLKQAIDERTRDPLARLNSQAASLDKLKDELQGRLTTFRNLQKDILKR